MTDCIFCKIANKEIPTDFLYENEHVVAFNDINPKAPVHILVIPKKHYKNLSELNDKNLMSEIIIAIQELTQKLGITDYKVSINNGEKAGQVVFHLHFHVLAGF